MTRSANIVGVCAIGVAFCLSCAANAEPIHHRARHAADAGRQIVVHPRDSFLTAGTGASFGAHNAHVLNTLKPPYRNTIQGTFVGLRGEDRLPNQYAVPGSNEPLFTF